jgi:transcriptional regulator with XRE-family HTH domain
MTTWSAIAELAHPGDSIRERRIELGWTQVELAAKSGIPQADISRIENGRLDARWSTIQRISAALADAAAPPQRSLANGRRTTRVPDSHAPPWTAKATTLPIARRCKQS